MVGELAVNEGRGTPQPFQLFGAPWLDGLQLAQTLNAVGLSGVRFQPERYTPRSVPGVAAEPRFAGQALTGVRVVVTDVDRVRPLAVGMHAMAAIVAEGKARGVVPLYGDVQMLHRIAGSRRLHAMLEAGAGASAILAAWTREVETFRQRRAPYLIY